MAADGQRFCLKWNDFRNSVTAVFEDLRQDEELVDITLCCEGKKVKAHRMMLSACSPYFRDLLKENPCQHPVFFLKDTTYIDLRAVIEFVYNGEVNVTQAQLSSFLKTAEMLQVRGLTGDDDKDSASAPPSPRTQQRPAPPRPFSRPAPPPAESPPASPSTKRRRLYSGSGSGSNDGLKTSAVSVSAPTATTDSASFDGPTESSTVKVEKIDTDIEDDDELLELAALGYVEDYEPSCGSNQSLGDIPVSDACQGEATTGLQEDDPLFEPFTHGWRREIVYRRSDKVIRRFDCYYFTPTGKRMRTLRQIQAFLDETNSRMSISCFSTRRGLLGAGPPHDIERHAQRYDGRPRSEKGTFNRATTPSL